MRYFKFEGEVYTVVNPSKVESLPGIAIEDPEGNLTCRDMRKALWALRRAPEMAYMLKHFNHESAFLGRLQCHPGALPIIKSDLGYVLSQDVRESWERLETALYSVSEVLFAASSNNAEAKMPFDAHWSLPTAFGYRKGHRTSSGARKAALCARDACALLLARCTMAIALCGGREEEPPRWIRVLVNQGIPAAWVDLLRESIVADLSPGLRVGAFIDPFGQATRTAWVNHVPCMVRANLPVYFVWRWQHDAEQVLATFPFLREYLPPPGPIPCVVEPENTRLPPSHFEWSWLKVPRPVPWTVEMVSRAGRQDIEETAIGAPYTVAGSASHPRAEGDKKPHGPGQRPGETFEEFFARRAKRNRERDLSATDAERDARDVRALKASTYGRPNRPTKVFLWKEAGDLDDCLPVDWLSLDYRDSVARKMIGDIWPLYPDAHKVYDAWQDEWDICPALAPDLAVEDDDAWEAGPDFEEAQSLPGGAVVPSSLFASELSWFYDECERTAFRPALEGFASLSRYRYGLVPIVAEGSGVEYDRFGEAALRKCFGLVAEDIDADARAVLRPASGLAAAFLRDPARPRAPGLIWDLEPTCDAFLLSRLGDDHIRLSQHTFNEDRMIRVQYAHQGEQDIWWALFVDEVTALELCRRTGIRNVKEAATFLAMRGSRLTIAYAPDARDRAGVNLVPPRPVFLGWRPSGFRPDGWDYKAYEQRAREVLSQPRGRAAALRGGIVWRLAVELLGEELVREVEEGPSADVWRHGHELAETRGPSWYEDALSSYELDVICGVYKVFTGICSPRIEPEHG